MLDCLQLKHFGSIYNEYFILQQLLVCYFVLLKCQILFSTIISHSHLQSTIIIIILVTLLQVSTLSMILLDDVEWWLHMCRISSFLSSTRLIPSTTSNQSHRFQFESVVFVFYLLVNLPPPRKDLKLLLQSVTLVLQSLAVGRNQYFWFRCSGNLTQSDSQQSETCADWLRQPPKELAILVCFISHE